MQRTAQEEKIMVETESEKNLKGFGSWFYPLLTLIIGIGITIIVGIIVLSEVKETKAVDCCAPIHFGVPLAVSLILTIIIGLLINGTFKLKGEL
jgi:xanthine/uracil permease